MILFNSLKLIFNNLKTMWKLLLYHLVVFAVFAGIFAGIIFPRISDFLSLISSTGVFEDFREVLTNLIKMNDGTLMDVVHSFRGMIDVAITVIRQNTSSMIVSYIFVIVISLGYFFVAGLAEYPLYKILDGNMTELHQASFMGTLLRTLGRGATMQALILLLLFPIGILSFIGLMYLFGALISVFNVFAFFFIFAIGIAVLSAIYTIFCLWRPYIVAEKLNPIKALGVSLTQVFKRFFRIYSQVILLFLMTILINALLGFFTCGVGLLVSVPLTMLFSAQFQMVLFYTVTHKRYYTDNRTIVATKLEDEFTEQDEWIEE